MPTFFVSLIELYNHGFNLLDTISPELLERFYEIREIEVSDIRSRQFMLTYYTHMTKEDVDNMTPYELDQHYELLVRQKELEAPKE